MPTTKKIVGAKRSGKGSGSKSGAKSTPPELAGLDFVSLNTYLQRAAELNTAFQVIRRIQGATLRLDVATKVAAARKAGLPADHPAIAEVERLVSDGMLRIATEQGQVKIDPTETTIDIPAMNAFFRTGAQVQADLLSVVATVKRLIGDLGEVGKGHGIEIDLFLNVADPEKGLEARLKKQDVTLDLVREKFDCPNAAPLELLFKLTMAAVQMNLTLDQVVKELKKEPTDPLAVLLGALTGVGNPEGSSGDRQTN